jgi:hypothetical protein
MEHRLASVQYELALRTHVKGWLYDNAFLYINLGLCVDMVDATFCPKIS